MAAVSDVQRRSRPDLLPLTTQQHSASSSQPQAPKGPHADHSSATSSASSPAPPFWRYYTDFSSSASSSDSHDRIYESLDGHLLVLSTDARASDKGLHQAVPAWSAQDGRQRFWQPEITMPPAGGIDLGEPIYRRPPQGGNSNSDDTLALILPLLILLSTLLFLLLLFIILVIVVRRRARIALGDSDGPVDVGREEALEGQGYLDGVEQRWLELQDPPVRQGYARAKDWTLSYPPGSQSTDITLSQFLSIQEKGVSAWSFDPDYESNPSVFVEARTEITFLADGEGMAPSEGGGCCVQSNLPLPKVNEVYYWEAKMFNKPDGTNVALGLTTKPYPTFRLPGWNKFSIGYFSADGFKSHNYPFAAQSYGPAYGQGDVIGIGYRPRTGTVFFTRNGKRLEDAFIGLNRYNLFPTVGADGACEVHVNLGQAGFVFIEANVKKWGLAPMVGTLAPPPAYGQERGSILIETGQGTSGGAGAGAGAPGARENVTPPPPVSPYDERVPSSSSAAARGRSGRPAPTTATATQQQQASSSSSHALGARGGTPIRSSSLRDPSPSRRSESSIGSPPNPPTPHRLDISMHSLHSSDDGGGAHRTSSRGQGASANGTATATATATNSSSSSSSSSYFPTVPSSLTNQRIETLRAAVESGRRSPSPPPYTSSSSSTSSSTAAATNANANGATPAYRDSWLENGSGALGGTGSMGARRGSGRTHAIANAVLGMLGDRGLLTPLSAQNPTASASSSRTPTTTTDEERYERDLQDNTRRNAASGSGSGSGENGWWAWISGR
ncbi:uncharacterized protein PFL1_05124 [Pseudozyma flocculosa PF-1]|uniref:Related to EAR1 - endosomal adaptor of Rsp5p n=2 Tax=Pseudozyma flocculosa TaxID=84751 RepID=A0A5C3F4Y4_9BASI|nr:uncharacterized protein PFL1_05124 [Pseudozyma flocculosa PF-1]EPQ27201.1 hypothetical protein PFL1_05124 [Pseudozyma flocculosa PF-1]SPO39564.1 related to EAR1 - endosomal adaptor of Rsp5p [Pseudozyma flocculosa]